jgi:acyl carrier protein
MDPDRLRNFIRREFLFDPEAKLSDDDPLFPQIVDSLGLMEVVSFVEETYGVEIDESDLVADNFRTLADLVSLITRRS